MRSGMLGKKIPRLSFREQFRISQHASVMDLAWPSTFKVIKPIMIITHRLQHHRIPAFPAVIVISFLPESSHWNVCPIDRPATLRKSRYVTQFGEIRIQKVVPGTGAQERL